MKESIPLNPDGTFPHQLNPNTETVPPAGDGKELARGETTYERAKEIMGDNFLGIEAIRKAFGTVTFALPGSEKVPYTEDQLKKAKAQGEILMLRGRVGREFTMKRMREIIEPTFSATDGKLLYNQDWYHNDDFYKNDLFKEGWTLISKEVLPDSTNKNYIEQTRVLRDYLKGLGALSEAEVKQVTDEKLDSLKDLLEVDYDGNWKKVARELSEFLINKNHRRTAGEALYDWILMFKDKGKRLLETKYDWTNTLASDGNLVLFGSADSRGAGVSWGRPGNSKGYLGVVSVR